MFKDQKTFFFALLGGASFIALILLFLNVKFIIDKETAASAIKNYEDSALLYANRTIPIEKLMEEIKVKRTGLLKRVDARNENQYLDAVQKIASIFSQKDVQVLEVNPKIRNLDIAKNFNVLNDQEFNRINEFGLRILVNGEEANILNSLDQIWKLPEDFYIEKIMVDHPDGQTRGNMELIFNSHWNKNE